MNEHVHGMHVRRASCSCAHARCHAEPLSPLDLLNCPVQRSLRVQQLVGRRDPRLRISGGGYLDDHYHQKCEAIPHAWLRDDDNKQEGSPTLPHGWDYQPV